MKLGTVEPRPQRASERSVFTMHRVLLVATGTAALTAGAWALMALIPAGQGNSGASIAALTTSAPVAVVARPTPELAGVAPETSAPRVWLASLTSVAPTSFAAPTYTPEPVLPRVVRPLPPLPPRPTVRPGAVTLAPIEAPDSAVATAQVPESAAAPVSAAPTPEAVAMLRAPRRSVFPAPRPVRQVAEAPSVAAPSVEPAVAETADPSVFLALARSRTPMARPEAVMRLASLSLDAPSSPITAAPRPQPLSVPSLDRAIARADQCATSLTRAIPRRARNSGDGTSVIGQLTSTSGSARDSAIVSEVLSGNIPDFLRDLVPVTFSGTSANGRPTQVTICVMPDYLAVGSDRDFVRVPMGLPAATRIAERFNMVLPTTRMVDAIYAQASVHLAPSPMEPGAQMSSTNYFLRHNATVEGQRARAGGRLGQLVSGQKKDLVLTNRLDSNPGRVAIYGWHRRGGSPIQPLSTVHGAQYADYSHGIRLISRRAYVNGQEVDLRDLLADSRLAGLVSSEGTISNRQMLAALR